MRLALLTRSHALLADQAVPERRAVFDAMAERDPLRAGPVDYWGASLGCGVGVPLVAAEPLIRATVLGLNGEQHASAESAARITVPVEFLVQWGDERVPRVAALALFDLVTSAEETLHAKPAATGRPGVRDGQLAAVLHPAPGLTPLSSATR